jgi:hypothetical protein
MTQMNRVIQDLEFGVGRGAKKSNNFLILTVQLDIIKFFYLPNKVNITYLIT